MQNTALKVFSARARESALQVRRHQDALGASEQPTGMANPKIRARVAEILAAKQKGKAKGAYGKGRGKKAPDPAKAKAKVDREKAAAAKKVEREKAKAERAGKQLSAATARETAKRERERAKVERVAAQAKKQAAQQAKLKTTAQAKRAKDKAKNAAQQQKSKQSAAVKEDKAKAAAGKQAAAQQHKTRVLSEKIKRGEKLSASDQVDAEDAGLVKRAGKAMDFAIKQSDEERAMFAKMGGGKGPGKGYDKSKSTLTTGKDKATGGGGGGGEISAHEHAALVKHAGDSAAATAEARYYKFNHSDSHAGLYDTKKIDSSGHHIEVMNGSHIQVARAHQGKVKAARSNAERRATSEIQMHNEEHRAGRATANDRARTIDRIKSGNFATKAIEDIAMDNETDDTLDLAIKAGARHSKMDASHLDEAARHLHAAGATCPDCAPDEEGDDDEAAGKAIKSIMDNPAWYAQHECNDIMQAGSALSTLAMLIQSELSEEDEDDADISQLCDAARTLIKFIGSELDELEGAAGDAAEGRTAGDVPMAKALKGIELGTLDGGEEIATVSGYAVKAIGDTGLVGGYLVKFGGDGDLSQWRDVFTKNTNFGKHTKSDVWVHHRMLPGLGKKQLTNQAELGMDDEGVFVKHLLDLRSSYETKLYGMIQAEKLGWSSGTAPHLVERKSLGDGRHEVTQWTLGLDASYTPIPAGGFVVNAGAMKSLFDDAGIDLLNAMYIDDSPEAVKANSDRGDGLKAESERARRLTLELSLMELEETAL